jgi:hypothetical protein
MPFAALLLLAAAMTRDEAVALARKVVAERLGPGTERPELVRATAAEWADSSLGCRGERKEEGPVSGYRVLLRTGGTLHRVHVADGRAVFCGSLEAKPIAPEGRVPDPRPSPPGDPGPTDRVARAREDLARRIGVGADEITLVEAREVVWPDASLGCPRPDMMYAQSTREGWLIRLGASGRTFEYHSSATGEPFYCENPRPPVGR